VDQRIVARNFKRPPLDGVERDGRTDQLPQDNGAAFREAGRLPEHILGGASAHSTVTPARVCTRNESLQRRPRGRFPSGNLQPSLRPRSTQSVYWSWSANGSSCLAIPGHLPFGHPSRFGDGYSSRRDIVFAPRSPLLYCLIAAVAFPTGALDRDCCCVGASRDNVMATSFTTVFSNASRLKPCCSKRLAASRNAVVTRTGGVSQRPNVGATLGHRCRCHLESRPADGRLESPARTVFVTDSAVDQLADLMSSTERDVSAVRTRLATWAGPGGPPLAATGRCALLSRWVV
jgi:hypothetical protein